MKRKYQFCGIEINNKFNYRRYNNERKQINRKAKKSKIRNKC